MNVAALRDATPPHGFVRLRAGGRELIRRVVVVG
jgi:hypothetical protein